MKRTLPRFLSKQVSRLISTKPLLKISTPVFLPFYHVVNNENLPHISNYNYRNINQFEKELDFYLEHFKPVSLADLLNPIPTNKKCFHITFDDGLKECAEVIAPILLKKGIPATFFVNPPFIDNKELFHKYKASLILRKLRENSNREINTYLREHGLAGKKILNANILQLEIIDQAAKMLEIDFQDFLKKQQPYMTMSQLADLQKKGFTIGAHSNHHPEFWKLSDEEQKAEITLSMNWIVKQFNPKIKAFAFPFTDSGVERSVMKSIREEDICDISFGTAGIKIDEMEYHFQRYPVENSSNFIGDLKAELVYFQFRRIIGQETVRH